MASVQIDNKNFSQDMFDLNDYLANRKKPNTTPMNTQGRTTTPVNRQYATLPNIKGINNDDSLSQLANNMYDFENSYYQYIQCKQEENSNCREYSCAFKKAYNKMVDEQGDIQELQTLIQRRMDKLQYLNEQDQEMVSSYLYNLITLRQELDKKMTELNDITYGFNDNQILYNSTIYSGILWTILASSLLYYVFVHLK